MQCTVAVSCVRRVFSEFLNIGDFPENIGDDRLAIQPSVWLLTGLAYLLAECVRARHHCGIAKCK